MCFLFPFDCSKFPVHLRGSLISLSEQIRWLSCIAALLSLQKIASFVNMKCAWELFCAVVCVWFNCCLVTCLRLNYSQSLFEQMLLCAFGRSAFCTDILLLFSPHLLHINLFLLASCFGELQEASLVKNVLQLQRRD